MPSTYSSNLRLELQATGENTATWGTKANAVFELIEDAIAGYKSIALSDANYTLTTTNGAADDARNMILNFTGTLTAARTITIPTTGKVYFMRNSTSGGFTLNVKTSSGNTITIENGNSIVFFCDGTNCVKAFEIDLNEVTAGTLGISRGGTGATTASAARTAIGADNASNLTTGTVSDSRLPTSQAGKTFTSGLEVQHTTPNIKLTDTTASAYDYWMHVDSQNFYVLVDRTGAGTWDSPHPLQLEGDTNTGYLFGNEIVTTATQAASFPAGTVMLFQQTSAPTGWTKLTTHNNKALRLTTGTVTTGGSVAFTTAFDSQTPSGSISSTTATGTVGSHTLTTAEIPSHSHGAGTLVTSTDGAHSHNLTTGNPTGASGGDPNGPVDSDMESTFSRSGLISSAGSHSHTLSGSTASAGSGGGHSHTFTGTSHSHTFTGTAINLDVQFVDVILAQKN